MISTVAKNYDQNGSFVGYDVVYNDGSKWWVPLSEANRHYQEILEWVANGGTIVDNGS